jgi:hypothetical protein
MTCGMAVLGARELVGLVWSEVWQRSTWWMLQRGYTHLTPAGEGGLVGEGCVLGAATRLGVKEAL